MPDPAGDRGLTASPLFSGRMMEVGWLVAAALIPSAMNPWGSSPFALPKSALLQASVLCMFLCSLGGLPRHSAPLPPAVRQMVGGAIVLGLVLLLATTLSVNPRVSLMGTLDRQQGLLTQLCYIFLFIAVAVWLRSEAQARRLVTALVWGSAPVVIYGLLQALFLDPLDWRSDAASQVHSTLGRANFFGTYLVLVIPMTVSLWLVASRVAPAGRIVRLAYGLLLLGQFAGLFLTLVRGAWLGFAAMTAVYAIGIAVLVGRRRFAFLGVGAAVLMAALVVVARPPAPNSDPLAPTPDPIAETQGVEQAARLTQFDRGSTTARLTVWRFTLPLIRKSPWLGYGPETFYEVFVEVFPPQLVYYHGRDVATDRAHNLWLDLAMSAGVLGVAAFAVLLVGFARLAWKGLSASHNAWQGYVWTGLCAAVAGFLVDQQFSFSLTDTSVVFWLLLGLGATLGWGLDRTTRSGVGAAASAAAGSLGIPILYLILVVVLCMRPLLADTLIWYSQHGAKPAVQAIRLARDAVWLEPRQPSYRVHLSRLYLSGSEFDAAEREIRAAERLDPNDPRVLSAVGEFYAMWGLREPSKLEHAERAYRRTLERAPHIATFHTALGIVLAWQGQLAEGIQEVERAVDLDATDGVAYAQLADLYEAAGRREDALRARREAVRLGAIPEGTSRE